MAEYSCVSIDKAALRSLACTLHQELKEKGIFVGIVTIMGNVVPETHYTLEKIAEAFQSVHHVIFVLCYTVLYDFFGLRYRSSQSELTKLFERGILLVQRARRWKGREDGDWKVFLQEGD